MTSHTASFHIRGEKSGLGINPDHELYTSDNRPLKLITEDMAVVKEALA